MHGKAFSPVRSRRWLHPFERTLLVATPETISVPLSAGGTITLTIDADFLAMDLDDFAFVRAVVNMVRNGNAPAVAAEVEPVTVDVSRHAEATVTGSQPSPDRIETVKVTKPLRDVDPNEAIEARRKADRDRQKAARERASASKPADPKSGKTGTAKGLDYTEVASHIVALRAAGVPVAAGLAKEYGVNVTTTKNWIAKCRQLGLIPKDPSPAIKVIEDNTGPDGDPQPFNATHVAITYREAVRNNQRPVQAVQDRFNVDRTTAVAYIAQARERGALPPQGEPQLPDAERAELLAPVRNGSAA